MSDVGAAGGDLLEALRSCVGAAHVLTDPDVVAGYCVDWTRRFEGSTPAVVRPASTDEVAAVVAVARAHRVALVPQGGNTGLVGGSVPLAGEVVVSLKRLRALDVDATSSHATVGAGVTLDELQRAAAPHGLQFGVDLGARDTATLGGMIATNAGGTHVVRYGDTRAQVVGVEAVLGRGDVVSQLARLEKDNTGYDLGALLCGSEGTLAIITAATVRLVPRPAHVAVALLGCASAEAAVEAARILRIAVPSLHALEFMLADGVDTVARALGIAVPPAGRAPASVLVEAAGNDDPTAVLAEAVASIPGLVAEPAVAVDAAGRAALWRLREGHPEAAATLGIVHKLDVSLPLRELALFLDRVRVRVAEVAPGARCLLYGHLGDGNVHVNVVGPPAGDDRIDDAVLGLVVDMGGSISAEHGIGTAKRAWLARARAAGDIAAYRAIKGALDPDRILNPNVLLP